ncbi:MAG: TVP38/TMEM64 family protein [Sulfurifustis sp.]
MNRWSWLRGLALLAALVAIGYAFDWALAAAGIDQSWIDNRIRGNGLNGEVMFVGVAALCVALGAPRQTLSFLGGYAFGLALGAALALLATVIGAVVSFYYARLLAGRAIRARFADGMRRFDEATHGDPFWLALFIRLLPVGNNLAVNVAAGVSRVRALPFFLGSLIGYAPQTIVFALAGSGIGIDPLVRIGLGAALFVISGALGVWLYGRYWRAHKPEHTARSARVLHHAGR